MKHQFCNNYVYHFSGDGWMDVSEVKIKDLENARIIRQQIDTLQGTDLGNGLFIDRNRILSEFRRSSTQYFCNGQGEPLTVFHYRNLLNASKPGNTDYHSLMHFGTLTASCSRAFVQRSWSIGSEISDDYIGTDNFRLCSNFNEQTGQIFAGEYFLPVRPKINAPFLMADIGQTQFLRNRAVLYASGLFTEKEIDAHLFDANGTPHPDIDTMVTKRLMEKGYDSIGYLNDIEDPGSLSFIILHKDQAELASRAGTEYSGFRYRYGASEKSKVIDCNPQGEVQIRSDIPSPFSKLVF